MPELGAVRPGTRNLIAPGAQPETVRIAEMTASGFSIARVPAMLGRVLLPEDEHPGAPTVAVIGHDVWTRRFQGDIGIVGREIRLGETVHKIVGVMPEGFGFPVSHSYWIPWRAAGSSYVTVFGRLAPGVPMAAAQAELSAHAERAAAASPGTHAHLRPQVLPYTFAFTDMDDSENALALQAIQTALLLLLVLVCVNVSILVYARTATRQGEIAVRTALGASRGRIVAQLFVEALVLAGVAAVAGVMILSVGLREIEAAIEPVVGRLPFWMDFSLSPAGAAFVVVLTLAAAAIVGVVPALKATGKGVQARLQGLSAGSGARMQMGRLWTVLIVAQVAITVALLPASMYHAWTSLRFRAGNPGFAAAEFLNTQLAMERSAADAESDHEAHSRRYVARRAELERRLEAEPAVRAVTFSMVGPGDEHAMVVELEGRPTDNRVDYNIVEGTRQGQMVRFNRIAPDFLGAFEVPLLIGRDLHAGDARGGAVVVNRSFHERLTGGENPVGLRFRYVGRSREADAEQVDLNRWFEIVGVVPDFPATASSADAVPLVYHAASADDSRAGVLAVRVAGDPAAFAGRLREIAAAVDPALQVRNVSTLELAIQREQALMRIIGAVIVAAMLSIIVLSAAGIYALMSFTVARRRKEIGIRAALGADPSRILSAIFARVFGQLALGAALGMAAAVGLEQVLEGEMFQGHGAILLPGIAALMTTVGVLAALGPARRGLAVQPTDALREE